MKRNKEMPIVVDVDDTLLMWHDYDFNNCVEVTDIAGEVHFRKVHKKHVDLLKTHAERGYQVIVWSANGAWWAEECVRVLELEDYVDLILCKPVKYIDDLPCQEWMGSRVYIPYEEEKSYTKKHALDPKGG